MKTTESEIKEKTARWRAAISVRDIITVLAVAIAVILLMLLYGFPNASNTAERLLIAANSTAIPAILLLSACSLAFIGSTGFFDIFGYAISRTASVLIPKQQPPHETYHDYKTKNARPRTRTTVPTVTGIVLLFISFILTLLYNRI